MSLEDEIVCNRHVDGDIYEGIPMTLDFNPMSDDRYRYQEPVLLLIGKTVHEDSYENSRRWFYLHNNKHWNDAGEYEELPDHIDEADERLNGWAFARITGDA